MRPHVRVLVLLSVLTGLLGLPAAASAAVDTTVPSLDGVQRISPDTIAAGDKVRVVLQTNDPDDGAAGASLRFEDPLGRSKGMSVYASNYGETVLPASATATVTTDSTWPAGTYKLMSIDLWDSTGGNSVSYHRGSADYPGYVSRYPTGATGPHKTNPYDFTTLDFTLTNDGSISPSPSPTRSASPSPSATPSPSASPSRSTSPTSSPTASPTSSSPNPYSGPSGTPSATAGATSSPTPSPAPVVEQAPVDQPPAPAAPQQPVSQPAAQQPAPTGTGSSPSASPSPSSASPSASAGGTAPAAPAASSPSGSATPSPSAAPDCRGATLALDRRTSTTGAPVEATVVALPGEVVRLWAYTRPATAYRMVRSGVVPSSGTLRFVLQPTSNTRLYAQQGACVPSASQAVTVSRTVSLSAAPRRGAAALSGTVAPRRGGLLVTVYRRTPSGLVALVQTRTAPNGHWSVTRALRAGRYELVARSAGDSEAAAGQSAVRAVRVA